MANQSELTLNLVMAYRSGFEPNSTPPVYFLGSDDRIGNLYKPTTWEPPTPSAKALSEPEVVGVVRVPKAGGPTRPICESAQVQDEFLTIEAVLTEERVPSLSTELAKSGGTL
ncbi:hypothetical protein Nepgr_016726 [Nepenthes gracilis]|uniref:Uncharacterized protein n=1 Tax=Nepenthes gracilis TaxID=150966 RepID=A0AAD3SN53_NEPGR|nr:hypothetical protein Nepgr_016726 [Nepenthes gracilis]